MRSGVLKFVRPVDVEPLGALFDIVEYLLVIATWRVEG